MLKMNRLAFFGLMLTLTGGVFAPLASAQTKAAKPHHSFLHRHRNAASAAAGVGGYKYAKSRKHGFMHRHPVLTGAAAAAVTHHYAKKRK